MSPVGCFAEHVAILLRTVVCKRPQTTLRACADDSGVSSKSVDGLKSYLQALRLAQCPLKIAPRMSCLRASFGFHKGAPYNFRLSLFDGIKAEIGRSARLPLSFEQHISVTCAAVYSKSQKPFMRASLPRFPLLNFKSYELPVFGQFGKSVPKSS